jgi:hypothetical protein
MNIKIPKWLHVGLCFVLAGLTAEQALAGSGQLTVAAPVASLLALAALVVHSVDPSAVGSKS